MRRIALALTAAALAVGVVACGDDEPNAASSSTDTSKPLVVGASPVPHAEILNFIKDNLAEKNGLDLEVKEFTDYVLPNTALVDGQLDANYFQTPAYLADQEQARNFKAVSVASVHIEPLGVYSRDIKELTAIPNGAQVAIPNDPTNEARALRLLAANKLLTLNDDAEHDGDHPRHHRQPEGPEVRRGRGRADAALARRRRPRRDQRQLRARGRPDPERGRARARAGRGQPEREPARDAPRRAERPAREEARRSC